MPPPTHGGAGYFHLFSVYFPYFYANIRNVTDLVRNFVMWKGGGRSTSNYPTLFNLLFFKIMKTTQKTKEIISALALAELLSYVSPVAGVPQQSVTVDTPGQPTVTLYAPALSSAYDSLLYEACTLVDLLTPSDFKTLVSATK